jgi:chromosome partitioning protein
MKTITIASAKGGSGKTTITSALAVRACQDTKRVAMIDLNFDQASLTQWWVIRGKPDAPKLVLNVENIPRAVKALAAAYDWLLIDTPPADMDMLDQAIAIADAVVIPVRSGIFDALAVQSVAEMAKERRKPFAFVLNAMDGHWTDLTAQTIAAIVDLGPVFATQIKYRKLYIAAPVAGKTGREVEKGKALRLELDALWNEVKQLAGGSNA